MEENKGEFITREALFAEFEKINQIISGLITYKIADIMLYEEMHQMMYGLMMFRYYYENNGKLLEGELYDPEAVKFEIKDYIKKDTESNKVE